MEVYTEDTKDELLARWRSVPKLLATTLKDMYGEKGAIISVYDEANKLIGLLGLLGITQDEDNIRYINIFAATKLTIHYLWIADDIDFKSEIVNELVLNLIEYVKYSGLSNRSIIYNSFDSNYLPVFIDNDFVNNDHCLTWIKKEGV